jgi:hypothetical protein
MEAIAVAISNEISPADQDAILALFDDRYEALPSGTRLGPGWTELFLVIKDVAPVFATSASIVSLINGILQWRKRTRSKGVQPAVQLSADGETVDLSDASDEEIAAWVRKRVARAESDTS